MDTHVLRLPASQPALPSVITCHSALPKPAGQPEKFPPNRHQSWRIRENGRVYTTGQHVTFHANVSLSSPSSPSPFSTRRYKLMYAFVVVAIRSFVPSSIRRRYLFLSFSFFSFLFFAFPHGAFRDRFQRRDFLVIAVKRDTLR